MAGPLTWFRKHQKLMLGVFGVLLMFVFTLSFGSGVDPIVDYLSGGAYSSQQDDPIVATWKGGKLKTSEINNLRRSRAMLSQLLNTAEMEAYQRNGRPQVPRIPQAVSDEAIMELILLTQEAERLGIKVGDDAILNFLTQFSGGTMQASEFLDLWQRITGGSERQLLAILRTELAAAKIRSMAWSGHRSTSPVQYWDHFNQLERFVSAELMPLAVDDYLDQVSDPSEAELKALYDEYKNRYPESGNPEPGFKRRMRRAFDYVKLNYNQFLQAEVAKITDEQVAEYYEANKEDFRETLPSSDLDLSPDETDAESAAVDSVNTDSEAAANESESAPAEMDAEAAADDAEQESAAAASDAVDEESDAAQQAPDPARDGTPKASLTPVPQATPDPQAPPTPVSEHAVEKPVASSVEQAETDTATSDQETATADEPSDGDQAAAIDAQAADEEAVKYRPLEEVADAIKERLAAETAQKNFKNAISQVQSKMDRYYRKYTFWEIQKDKQDTDPPQMPDLAEIDSPVPLNIQSMPLSDRFESAAYELGQAYDLEFDSQSIEQVPFSQTAYTENLPVYQPSVFPSGEAMTKFVFWVTAQEDAYTPKLEEIRDEVVRAWKLEQARELALADAEKAAEQARQKGTSLSEACAAPGRNFLDSGEISWFTGGSVGLQAGGLPQPASIPGIEFTGHDFLETMFRLREGEVGVALDGAEKTAYVIRVTGISPSVEQRQQKFVTEGINTPAVGILARRENQRVLSQWYEDLLDSYDVTWTQDPSSREQ